MFFINLDFVYEYDDCDNDGGHYHYLWAVEGMHRTRYMEHK